MSYNFGSVSSEFAIFSLLEFVCYLVLSLSFTQLYIFLLLGSSKCSQEVIPLSWTVMLMPCYRVASGNRILLPSGCAALTHTCVATTGQTGKLITIEQAVFIVTEARILWSPHSLET
jgi:hypothetical protein